MMRRMGRPGLIGTMARTAVVAGTATAVAGNVSRRQAERAQATGTEPAPAPETATADSAAEPTGQESSGEDLSSQLERLASLKTAGVISEAEFTAAKALLLGI